MRPRHPIPLAGQTGLAAFLLVLHGPGWLHAPARAVIQAAELLAFKTGPINAAADLAIMNDARQRVGEPAVVWHFGQERSA